MGESPYAPIDRRKHCRGLDRGALPKDRKTVFRRRARSYELNASIAAVYGDFAAPPLTVVLGHRSFYPGSPTGHARLRSFGCEGDSIWPAPGFRKHSTRRSRKEKAGKPRHRVFRPIRIFAP
jgi:hypothetical protein